MARLLRAARRRRASATARRAQAGLPPAGPPAAPRRQPRRRRGRGAVQRGRASPTRRCATPRSAQRYDRYGTDGLRSAAAAGGDPFGGGLSAISSTRSSAAAASAAAAAGPSGPPRGADLEAMVDVVFEEAVFGSETPVTVQHARRLRHVLGDRRRAGHASGAVPRVRRYGQVRRVRQSMLGQMVTARRAPAAGARA